MQTKELGKIELRRYPGLNGGTRTLISDKEIELLNELSLCLELGEKTRFEELTEEIRKVQRLQKEIMRGVQIDF